VRIVLVIAGRRFFVVRIKERGFFVIRVEERRDFSIRVGLRRTEIIVCQVFVEIASWRVEIIKIAHCRVTTTRRRVPSIEKVNRGGRWTRFLTGIVDRRV
jgi:hypothetical protein